MFFVQDSIQWTQLVGPDDIWTPCRVRLNVM